MKRPAFLSMGLLAAILAIAAASSGGDPTIPPNAIRLSVFPAPMSAPMKGGFIGLSLEFRAIEGYAGANPRAINPILVSLVRNLDLGRPPVLRIGGNSTDWTWWPVPGLAKPGGVTYTLGHRWLAVTKALAQATGAQLILGINLEAADLRVERAEAEAFLNGIGSSRIKALELGNEPELWGTFSWYRTPSGQPVTGRPGTYDMAAFTRDFETAAAGLPTTPLAGPATGAFSWMQGIPQFLGGAPRLNLVTIHRYPLNRCWTTPGSQQYPTIPNLLSQFATSGLADGIAPYVALAHSHGLPARLGELNSVACSGDHRVSDVFASALWSLDTLFEMARVGVDGINVHTFPGAAYGLFDFSHPGGRWHAAVHPEYYGLLAFAQADPPGARLLPIAGAGWPVRAWATRARNGTIHVVLVNFGRWFSRTYAIRIPGRTATGALERLRAPGLRAAQDITYGGYGFGPSTTTGSLPHRSVSLDPIGNTYVVHLPAASAAILTVPAR